MRRIDIWRATERDAPAATARAVKEVYDDTAVVPAVQQAQQAQGQVQVRVFDADTIDLGLSLLRSGAAERPLLLILADDCFPGGCVATGSGAQEEALFRRTNLCRVLSMSDYPIRDGEAIYAPGVVVFKNGERHATDPFGPLVPAPAVLDFVACPGLRHPALSSEGRLYEADEARLALKIRTVLQVAARHGHDAIVLGALGCGAWKCPSRHVAEVFARELAGPAVAAAFKRIDFAVLKGTAAGYITIDHADGKGADGKGADDNFDVFSDVFFTHS
jgi:uncharacterized protein (TIGR02452 family)